ncbi:DUF1775 domain-containing protein [Brucella gallinifaecis]|uniref:DUF1775 domain-containing protein n=1 Tax=Brucella gallinifaecis TaxID=215590 RepID=A0A502BLP4_9HYPH|nr:DUF1775 domain-containing protein [Brucella gallinifaecis]TPF75392.1 DUF1775 domain-containing protein [Brucella gallinifaecis]
MKNTRLLTSAISLFAICASAGMVNAHSSLEQGEAKAGSFYKAVLRIPHGCGAKATTSVKIELPEGFVSAQPQAKAGWKIETAKGDYAQSYKVHGRDVTSGVKQVTFSEGELPSDFYDEFVVVGQLAKFDKDTTLSFPVTQFCGTDDSVAWTEIAADGQDPHDLKNPAPQLRVLVSSTSDDHSGHGSHGDHAVTSTKLGELSISGPSIRAMVPGAKVAGGYLTIKNNGKDADKLVGVTTTGVKRVEIHEMSMENQVMKMRELKDGLNIPAGETVELKSGGYHLMFIQPDHPYKEGDKVTATLEFEKSGKVDLEFPVTAQSGKSEDHSHH